METKLGILAGGGSLPARLIENCRQTGRDYYVIAFKGHTDPGTVEGAPHDWVRLGAAGRAVRLLHDNAVEDLVMAGAIRRPTLSALRPDLWTARFFAKYGAAALGDDGLLSAVVRILEEEEGFRIVGIDSLLPGTLAEAGVLGAHKPDEQALGDIERGIQVARGIGELDVGQAAVVQQSLVLCVEAAEGTDAMLARVPDVSREGPGGVLVKVKKPRQERRADLPTVGSSTVEAAAAAGLRGIAIEASGTLIVEPEKTVQAADAAGLFIVAVQVPEGSDG